MEEKSEKNKNIYCFSFNIWENNKYIKITLYKCTENTPKILFFQDLNNSLLIELLANEWGIIK